MYISSNDNRFYVALESSYGAVAAVTGRNRIPAVKLSAVQQLEKVTRKDKTGSRTFPGLPTGLRRKTTFDLSTYLTTWTDPTRDPSHGPLVQSAMGGTAKHFAGGAVASTSGTQLQFSAPHGLTPGQAVKIGGEIRFATAIADPQTVILNAPFTAAIPGGSTVGPTATYAPAKQLPSISLFDYWTPSTAVQRVLTGGAIDRMRVKVNGDFHEFEFSGLAADLIDSTSFAGGQGGLSQYPVEPADAGFDYTIIPGHLGQVWIGPGANQFLTLTAAQFTLENNLELRSREFGSILPRSIAAGQRNVSLQLSLFSQDDAASASLYQAARQRSPVSVMLQLGQQAGQLVGILMNSVIPEVPQFDDGDRRLQWKFDSSRAQGTTDDEVYLAFG